jgi:hypothetical protein
MRSMRKILASAKPHKPLTRTSALSQSFTHTRPSMMSHSLARGYGNYDHGISHAHETWHHYRDRAEHEHQEWLKACEVSTQAAEAREKRLLGLLGGGALVTGTLAALWGGKPKNDSPTTVSTSCEENKKSAQSLSSSNKRPG